MGRRWGEEEEVTTMGREQGLAGALRGSSLLHQNQLDRYNHFVTNTEEEEEEEGGLFPSAVGEC